MRGVSALTGLVSVLTWCAVAAAPAAGSGVESALCDPLGGGGAFAAPAGGIVGRGGQIREPDLRQVHGDLPASAKGRAGPRFDVTVPVYFHVITAGATGNLTNAQIADQMAVLNNNFAGREGGARTGFSFTLAGVTRTDNAAWFFAGPGGVDEHSMKAALRQGGANALNLYSTTAGPYLGWAYLPDIVTKPGQRYLDGVVVDWESMPGTSTAYEGRYDLGKTATHEAGHWLNLEHTFYRGCSAKGDFVDDTPAQKSPTSGCPIGRDSCPEPGLDPIHNYMDYSFDSCYSEFTEGQSQRMRDAWLFYRAAG
jgi:Pregnancy-associated plasma protein-A